MSLTQRHSFGFTLIEVLIAVAILAMISVLSWQSMTQMIGAQGVASDRDEAVHEIQIAFDKFMTDFSQAFLAVQNFQGVKQTSKPAFIGKKESAQFATFAGRRYFGGLVGSDQCEVGYSMEADPDAPGTYVLSRRQSDVIDDKPEEGGRSYPLLANLKQLQFEFYDEKNKEWVSEWDSTQISKHERLPRAVRVTVSVATFEKGEESGETPWTIEVALPLYSAPLNF